MNNSLSPLDAQDIQLIAAARAAIRCSYDAVSYRHTVGAAVLCGSGAIYTSVNVYSLHGACAEQVAIGTAAAHGEHSFLRIVAVRGVLACNRLMDEQKFNQADALMARMLAAESGMAGIHRGLLVCDRIYIELIGVARREAIEAMLTKAQAKFMKSMRRYPSVLRTEYALALLLEKNAARAEGIRAEFEKAAKSYPYPQETESEQQLICLALNKSRGRV